SYGYIHAHAYSNSYSDAFAYTNSNSNSYTNSHSDSEGHCDSYANSNPKRYSQSNAAAAPDAAVAPNAAGRGKVIGNQRSAVAGVGEWRSPERASSRPEPLESLPQYEQSWTKAFVGYALRLRNY